MSQPPEYRACDYCQLPVVVRQPRPEEKVFCCFGCRLAAQITGQRGERGAAQSTLVRLGVAIFLSMNVMMFTMALWTGEMSRGAASSPLSDSLADLFRYLCLVLSLPVLWLLGKPLFDNAWLTWRSRTVATDLLILLGVAASFAYSAHSVVRGGGHVYFEVGCVVLIMVTLGRWLEATAKIKTTEALDELENLLPDRVRLLATGDNEPGTDRTSYQWTLLHEVKPGDKLLVGAGERIPVDGLLIDGNTLVDQQVLTGESQPVAKAPGDRVLEGTLNLDGTIVIDTIVAARQGTWARLLNLVRQGQAAQGHYQRLTEWVARRFLPVVVSIAALVFVYHFANSGLETAILAALAITLIACPCALGLATPMAVAAAFGTALRHQVLFRSGEALERLACAGALAFDKTGTLTTGSARVVRLACLDEERRDEVLERVASMVFSSSHPFADAIRQFLEAMPLAVTGASTPCAVVSVSGRGLMAVPAEGGTWLLGSQRWIVEMNAIMPSVLEKVIDAASDQGEPLSLFAVNGRVEGVFIFEEQLRPGALAALEACRRLGCETLVLTGDHQRRGARLAHELNVEVFAELLPHDKVAAIERLRSQYAQVAMIGDGLNDAPALAAADVGVALACGTDLARDSAGVCLLSADLERVSWSIALARRTVRIIRQNLFWAFAYNSGGIALAATGHLNPGWASLAMVASSLLVIVNSLRLSEESPPRPALRRAVDRLVDGVDPATAEAIVEQASTLAECA